MTAPSRDSWEFSKVKVNGVDKDVLNDTISVNPVEFFNAPVETAECLSNIGVTGDLACPVNKVLAEDADPGRRQDQPLRLRHDGRLSAMRDRTSAQVRQDDPA